MPCALQAQGAASPDAAVASAAQLTRRLRDLITRLDTLLPYLGLAISTAVLLNQGVLKHLQKVCKAGCSRLSNHC